MYRTHISSLSLGNSYALQFVFSMTVWAQVCINLGSNSERRVYYSRVRNLSEAIKMNDFRRQMSSTDLIE